MTQSISLNALNPDFDAGSATTFHTVQLNGYCSAKGSSDIPCSLIGLAYDSGIVLSSIEVAFADEVLVALPHLGLQKGVVSQVVPGGFEIHFSQGAYSKIWPYLDWLKDASARPDQENRRDERIVPIRKLVTLERAGEPPSMARIVDLSRSGVAFTTSKPLMQGEPVVLGRHAGHVIRLFAGGAAVQFDEAISADRFNVIIDLDAV